MDLREIRYIITDLQSIAERLDVIKNEKITPPKYVLNVIRECNNLLYSILNMSYGQEYDWGIVSMWCNRMPTKFLQSKPSSVDECNKYFS